jgi:outer membrane protein TolC
MKNLALALLLASCFATPATALTLEQVLKAVESQSAELQVEKSLKDETTAKASGIRLNPPMVGIMSMRDAGGTNQGIEISQELPFPTKASKELELRRSEAEAQRSNYQYRRNEILLMARNAYFEYWQAYEQEQILKEKRDWLKAHSKIARSTARSDSAAQVHLLGIESQADLLENEVLEAESKVIEKRSSLKTYVPDLQNLESIPVEPKLQSLEKNKPPDSALISWKENELKAAEIGQSLKKQAYLPDLFLRYRGYNGNETTARNEELMVGISLPFLFFWQPQADSREASAKYQRAQASLRKSKLDLENRLTSLVQKAESLKKQLSALNDKLIPRAHKRMKLVENLSQRTMEGLDEHRVVMLDYLDLRMKALDARTQYENTVSEIMKFVSLEVTP